MNKEPPDPRSSAHSKLLKKATPAFNHVPHYGMQGGQKVISRGRKRPFLEGLPEVTLVTHGHG